MNLDASESEPLGVFSDDYTVANLKRLVLRGGAVKLGSQAVKFVLRIGGLFLMARFLSPQDFGVFAMLATFTGFLEMFNSTNLILPTVQKALINHQQVSVLFWVSAGLGAALALITAAAGPAIAWFYGDPRLVGVALAFAPIFVMRGLAIQHQALLQRQMRFVAIELSGLTSQSLGAIAMIFSAWRGAGYWSLVINALVMSATDTVLFWSLARWRPSLPRRGSGVREMLSFGGDLSSYEVFCYIQRSLDKILIGRVWGAQAVGLYVKAIGLVTLSISQLVNPISYVVIPALSRLQSQEGRYRAYYSKTVGGTVFLTMALVSFTCVYARQIVLTALGRQWLAVVPIFQALMPAAGASTLTVMYTWVCLSLGHGERLSRATFLMASGTLIAFLIGLPWGPIGVAKAYSVAYCVLILPILKYSLTGSLISLRDIGAIVWRPAVAAVAAACLAVLLEPFGFHPIHPPVQLAGDFFLFGTLYFGVWLVMPGGISFLRELYSSARKAL